MNTALEQKNEAEPDAGDASPGGPLAGTAPEILADRLPSGAAAVRRARPDASDYSAGFESLVNLAEGHFLDPSILPARLAAAGQEHIVWPGEAIGRTFKATYPNQFGKTIGEATPQTYFERLGLANQIFGDDIRMEGLVNDGGKLRVVTSQTTVKGSTASPEDVVQCLEQHGFHSLDVEDQQLWHNPQVNVVAFDAHTSNFIKTPEGVIPIDVNLARITPKLSAAIKAAVTKAKATPPPPSATCCPHPATE